jgi:hypothetical protein
MWGSFIRSQETEGATPELLRIQNYLFEIGAKNGIDKALHKYQLDALVIPMNGTWSFVQAMSHLHVHWLCFHWFTVQRFSHTTSMYGTIHILLYCWSSTRICTAVSAYPAITGMSTIYLSSKLLCNHLLECLLVSYPPRLNPNLMVLWRSIQLLTCHSASHSCQLQIRRLHYWVLHTHSNKNRRFDYKERRLIPRRSLKHSCEMFYPAAPELDL